MPEHSRALATLVSDPEVAMATLLPSPYSETLALEWIQSLPQVIQERRSWIFGIFHKSDKMLMGVISLSDLNFEHGRAELGYWLGRPFWGCGYMHEAASIMVDFGFGRGLKRIYATISGQNLRSESLLARLGFQWEGCLRRHITKNGHSLDQKLFGLLKSDFPSAIKSGR